MDRRTVFEPCPFARGLSASARLMEIANARSQAAAVGSKSAAILGSRRWEARIAAADGPAAAAGGGDQRGSAGISSAYAERVVLRALVRASLETRRYFDALDVEALLFRIPLESDTLARAAVPISRARAGGARPATA